MPDTPSIQTVKTLPTSTTAVAYLEHEVDRWIKARIRGEEWTPGPLPEHPSLIRKAEVVRRVGLSDVTIWKLEREGRFPARVQLTAFGAQPIGFARRAPVPEAVE